MKNLLLLPVLSVFFASSLAAQAAKVSKKEDFEYTEKFDSSSIMLSADEYKIKEREAAKIASREPANNDPNVTKELASIVQAFAGAENMSQESANPGVSSVKELDSLIDKAEDDKYFNSLPIDAQFVVAQLPMIRAYRGLFYRIRPFAEEAPVVQSAVLTMIRNAATARDTYLPGQQWDVIVQYLSQPQDNMELLTKAARDAKAKGQKISNPAEATRIHNSSEFKTYLTEVVLERYKIMNRRLRQIEEKMGNSSFYFDNRITYGPAAYQDELDRYRRIGKAEIWALLSANYAAEAQIRTTLAYSLSGVMGTLKALGQLQGVDVVKGSLWDAQGVTARQRVSTINRNTEILKIVKGGQGAMKAAFSYMKLSIDFGALAEEALKNRKSSEKDVLDAGMFQSVSYRMDLGYKKLKEMMAGPTELRSQVTGKVLKVNVPEFFNNPPADLKKFFPIAFRTGDPEITKSFVINGQKVSDNYRNYRRDEANAWDISAYRPYFPNVDESKDIPAAAKILSQSYGGFLVLGPLASVMF